MSEVLALMGVEVRVDRATILGPIDLEVCSGQQWAVLGPNGSGKTTLLSLAGARRQPSAGEVRVLGGTLGRTDVRALRPRIGHVSHAVADRLRPSIRALDVVRTGRVGVLESWWLDDGDDDALAALAAVGCEGLAERAFGACSLGERQRVLVARAMVGRHDLLLFDEPAAGLDLPARESLLEAMTALAMREDAPTTVLATHHVEEIPPTTTHAVLLRGGRLTASGPVGRVLSDEPMTSCFEIPISVERRDGRWTARSVR